MSKSVALFSIVWVSVQHNNSLIITLAFKVKGIGCGYMTGVTQFVVVALFVVTPVPGYLEIV